MLSSHTLPRYCNRPEKLVIIITSRGSSNGTDLSKSALRHLTVILPQAPRPEHGKEL